MPAVVLYQPEIPGNTGNIGRLCVATSTPLHLIEPLGFQLTDRHLKRAGLDYWGDLELYRHRDWESFCAAHPDRRIVAVSTKGTTTYSDWQYHEDDMLLFGRETAGLPPEILSAYPTVTIPLWGPVRSLNLSSAAAIVLYESHRQLGFGPGAAESL